MKPTPEQVAAFAGADLDPKALERVMLQVSPPPVTPPDPYTIALAFAGALLASGRYEDKAAAVHTAWTLVIPFYQGKLAYELHGRELFNIAAHASRPEGAPDGEMSEGEARAYVTGGETGETGEVGAASPLVGSQTIDATAIAARWATIGETTTAVVAAQAALEEAAANRRNAPQGTSADDLADLDAALDAAQAAFDQAAAAQSKAYE